MDGANLNWRCSYRAEPRRCFVVPTARRSATIVTNADLLARRHYNVPRGVAGTHPIAADRAEGVWLWDVEGRKYLDFTSGIGVMNVGHHHPHVTGAIQRQLEKLTHTCFQVTMYEPY